MESIVDVRDWRAEMRDLPPVTSFMGAEALSEFTSDDPDAEDVMCLEPLD